MANIDRPTGLRIYQECLRATLYPLSSGLAQDLFIGDPVAALATGYVSIATAGTGNKVLGAILAVYDKDMVPLPYWDSGHSGVGFILVADAPEQMFVAQGDGDTSYLAFADRNGNVNLASGSGSTVSYLSGWELDDSDTGASTAGHQIRLVKPVPRADNTEGSARAEWVCRINNHQALQGIVGAGI